MPFDRRGARRATDVPLPAEVPAQLSGTSSSSLSFDAPVYVPVGQAQDLRKRDDGRYRSERCAVVVLNRPRRGLAAFPPSTDYSACRKKGKMCVAFGLPVGGPGAGRRRSLRHCVVLSVILPQDIPVC